MELVSVVIPCYKQARFLGEAIESVLAQSYGHHEIIVIDDGSPDNPQEVVMHYPGVKYRHQHNQGVSKARNRGLFESTGEYIVFLDAEDPLIPNNFQAALKAYK
jgi:glycosyltransferase involved in cell wall biosynthesis